jgi:hypothetical protein
VMNPGIPIVSPVLEAIASIGGGTSLGVKAKTNFRHRQDAIERFYLEKQQSPRVYDVTPELRDWFAGKFGVSHAEQKRIEKELIIRVQKLSKAPIRNCDWIGNVHPIGSGIACF